MKAKKILHKPSPTRTEELSETRLLTGVAFPFLLPQPRYERLIQGLRDLIITLKVKPRYKVHFFSALIFSLTILNAVSYAQEQEPGKHTGSISLTQPKKSFQSFFGEVRVETMQYLTPLVESPNLTSSQYLSARLAGLYQSENTPALNYAADMSAVTFFIRSQSNYLIKELYVSYKGSDTTKTVIGRKKHEWSALDSYWLTSIWQPNFAIDLLRPEEQGLFGVFLDHKQDNVELLAFATPIFIPSIGPDIREEGGSLVSDSRWYRRPSDKYNFNDRINSITYKLDIPDIKELVGKPGMGFSAKTGDKESGPWITVSGGYKPVNQLLLKRQNYKIIDQDQVDVKVKPDATYHGVFSTDVGYKFGDVKTTLSYLEDNPIEKKPEVDWAIQSPQGLRAYSMILDFQLPNFFERNLQVQVAYLRVFGGEIIDITSEGPDTMTLFDDRMKFKNALSLKVMGPLFRVAQKPLIAKFSYLYDYLQRGTLIGTEFHYLPSTHWAVLVGADFLGVQDEDSSSRFLNQYRANDRVYGGLSYVF